MKLLVFKINSLLLIAAGAILGAHAFEIPEVEHYWQQALAYYEQNSFVVLAIAGVTLVVFGIYGFLPKLPNRSERRSIHFSGAHGDVVIQLDSVQASLTKIMTNMPEIRKVDVKVDPDKKRERAIITADVVLENQADADARQTANVVSSYIAETAIRMLGLEDLATVNLKITGIHLNPKKASKAIRASRASHELGRSVGRLTHVEVRDDAPEIFEEIQALEDTGLRSGPGSQALQTAGEMMAALDEADRTAEAAPGAPEAPGTEHVVLEDEESDLCSTEMTDERQEPDDCPELAADVEEDVLPPLAQDDAVEVEESEEEIPSIDFADETTEPGLHESPEATVDPILPGGEPAVAEDADQGVQHDDNDKVGDSEKKDKGGWGFV